MEVITDDATLLNAWRDGDRESGVALFDRYYDLLARFFANKAAEARDDLVQATLMACLEKVDTLRKASSFRSFLLSIARYELLHYYRRRSRRETPHDFSEISVYDLEPSPSRIIAEHQEQRLLLEALRYIPVDLQIVLELSYWEKASSREIAEVLGIPEGTVKSRVRRARERLKAAMAELAESPQLLESTSADLDQWANGVRERLVPRSR
ncbi:MAG: RNA polymerase sigma factor [Nannocystaceae bacterium]